MPIVAGVDGGSTKTVALVSDLEGCVIGRGSAGSSNHEIVGISGATRAVRSALQDALVRADKKRRDLAFVHMGLSGQDWPEDEAPMRKALARWLGDVPVALENDAFLGIRACTAEAHGITVSAGSGVCCSLIRPNGEKYTYGYHADLGGGIDIDARTLQAVVRSEDGRGAQTTLTSALLAALHFASVGDLLRAMSRGGYRPSHRDVRPVLFGTAEQGDPAARGIVVDFGHELALFATNLIRREGPGDVPVDVVASGSLFVRTGALLFSTFEAAVREAAPHARVHLADQEPALGAVRAALAARGVKGEEPWRRLTQTVRPWLEPTETEP